MALVIDIEKGKRIASFLPKLFAREGLNGRKGMPEDNQPDNVVVGSLEHVLFITLTVSIDYQRDANQLWEAARVTYRDAETRYLFQPAKLSETKLVVIEKDMEKHGLSKKNKHDPLYWRTNALTFLKKWSGDPRNFLASCGWGAPEVLSRLKSDTHEYNGRKKPDYLYLKGDKIGPLWLRMMRDNVGESRLKNLDKVPIPVDIHVARATYALGIVSGNYEGSLSEAYEFVREAWFHSVLGLRFGNRKMIALDMDQSLWHLSKYGCTKRNKESGKCPLFRECDLKKFCTMGRISVAENNALIST